MWSPKLETRQMRYFLAVAEHGSFTRAAQEPLIAQPSLSQAIARLERQLGFPLFHRVGGSVVLSATGRDLLEPCRRALRAVQSAEDVVEGSRGSRLGRLDLVAMPSVSIAPGADLIAQFVDGHPDAWLSVLGAWTDLEVLTAVREGKAEVGLYGTAQPVRERDLVTLDLGTQGLVVASPAGTDLPAGPLAPADLAGCSFVTSHAGSFMRSLVDELLADQPDTRVVCEVDHRSSLLPLVLAGVGHAVLPDPWRGLAEQTGLEVRDLDGGAQLHTMVVSREKGLTPLAVDFMELAGFLSA